MKTFKITLIKIINDFKKDTFKLFNSYYFKSSMLTYDLNNKVFENILLNKENAELVLEIISQLLPKLDEGIENNYFFYYEKNCNYFWNFVL